MSQRVEQIVIDFIMGYHEDPGDCAGTSCPLKVQRGQGPTVTEIAVLLYVMGKRPRNACIRIVTVLASLID